MRRHLENGTKTLSSSSRDWLDEVLQDTKPFNTLFLRISQVFLYMKCQRPFVSDIDGNYGVTLPTILVPLSFQHTYKGYSPFFGLGFRNSWINLRRHTISITRKLAKLNLKGLCEPLEN